MINVVERVRNALECTYKDKGKREYVCKYNILDRNSLTSIYISNSLIASMSVLPLVVDAASNISSPPFENSSNMYLRNAFN